MKRKVLFIALLYITLSPFKAFSQHIIKNSLYFNTVLQNNANNNRLMTFPILYDLGYEQFINSRVSLSLSGGISIFTNMYKDYQSISPFSSVELKYGQVYSLTYEAKYFFNESDGFYTEGGYLASSIAYRTIKESINGPQGKVDSRIACFPYTIKYGGRSVSDYMGLFVDYYVGLGVNLSTHTNRGPYKNSNVSFGKPSPLPFTLGFTAGYVF